MWDRALNLAYPMKRKYTLVRPWIAALACGILTAISFNIYANHLMLNGGGRWQESILQQRDATLNGAA